MNTTNPMDVVDVLPGAEQINMAGTLPIMLCCMCGVAMQTNPANTCAQCLQTQHDVTDGLLKTEVICKCRGCDRYQRDATGWLDCHRESRELLAFCLKKIKGLKTVKLVDAVFVWTEPHSKRIKVKLTVQKEVVNGVLLQQSCVIEFVEQNRMCEECHRAEGNEVSTWNSVVQVRQKVNHKRTFLFLEQLILRHNACDRTLKIDPQPNGVDFYFTTTGNAVRFHDFLQSVIPTRYKRSKKIISMDIKSNIAIFNHTFAVDVVPICKDDILCLPLATAKRMGNISQILICMQVGCAIRMIDPRTTQICEMSSMAYWKHEFRSLGNARQLVEFVVLDVVPVEGAPLDALPAPAAAPMEEQEQEKTIGKKRRRAAVRQFASAHRMRSNKHQLCDVHVARASDLGDNDTTYITRSHLGFILKPGDSALGYDFMNLSYNPSDIKALREKETTNLPDIVLVRKFYPKYRSKIRERDWKLKSLAYEAPNAPGVGVGLKSLDNEGGRDLELFMQEIEEDPEMRQKINLYRDPVALQLAVRKAAAAASAAARGESALEDEAFEEDAPRVALDELLDEMQLEDDSEAAATVAAAVAAMVAGKPYNKGEEEDDEGL